MAGFGALPPMGGAIPDTPGFSPTAPVAQNFGIPSFQPFQGQAAPQTAPLQQFSAPIDPTGGGANQRANQAFAIGGIYDAYKKAKLDDITYSNTLNKAGREQLNNIYEAGLRNPQVQTDPNVLQQINHLHGAMGLPQNAGQPGFSWDSLQPVKTLNDLTPQLLEYFQGLPPTTRKSQADSYGIVAGADFYTAPAKLPPAVVAGAQAKFLDIMSNNKWMYMTPAQAKATAEELRVPLGQLSGDYGYIDKNFLDNPEIFAGISLASQQKLDKFQGQIDKIKGLDPVSVAKIKDLMANATHQTSMAGLADAQTKLTEIKIQDLPEKDKLFAADVKSRIEDRTARRAIMQERVALARAGKSTDATMLKDLKAEDQSARATVAHFDSIYYGMVKNYQTPDPELAATWQAAHDHFDAIHAAYLEAQSPQVQAAVARAIAGQTTGLKVAPVQGDTGPKVWGKIGNGQRGYRLGGKLFNEQNQQVDVQGNPI